MPLDPSMLFQVEASLQEALEHLDAREAALDALQITDKTPRREQELRQFRDSIDGIETKSGPTGHTIQSADLALATGEKLLRDYLAQVAQLRHGLAEWTRRAIG